MLTNFMKLTAKQLKDQFKQAKADWRKLGPRPRGFSAMAAADRLGTIQRQMELRRIRFRPFVAEYTIMIG